MRPPQAEDPLDPNASAAALHEARIRLLEAAREAQRAWLVVAGLAVLVVIGATVVFSMALFVNPGYVVMWALLLSAVILNATRFWPTTPEHRGVPLSVEEVRRLRVSLDPHTPYWPSEVSLVPEPTVEVNGRHLSLGMPLLACLAHEDLRRLVAIAVRSATGADEEPVIRRVLKLVHRDITRLPFLGRNLPIRAHGRTARLQAGLRTVATEYWRWCSAFRDNAEASSSADALAMHHQDLVIEGWQLMRAEWITPSLAQGCWHRAPFSSLQDFLAGAQAANLLDGALPSRPSRGALVDLVARHEDAVGAILLGERRSDDLRTINWADHPAMVTVPMWRATVAEALDVARHLTGVATEPTVEGVLDLVESGDLKAVARYIAPNHGIDEETVGWPTFSRWIGGYPTKLLIATMGMAAVDSGRFYPQWSWPDGTSLVNNQGWVLPMHQIAEEVMHPKGRDGVPAIVELEVALGELGLDVTEALWLTGDEAAGPVPTERPTGSFVAYERLGSRQVIVTDRAFHVFGRAWTAGLRDRYARRMRGADELRTRMLRVWQGDETDQTAYVPEEEVLRARFSLLTGGGRWRLVMHGKRGRLTLRGFGEGRTEEQLVAGLLGERLKTTWLHSSSRVRRIRNAVGATGTGLGGLAMVGALALAIVQPPQWPDQIAPYLALGGVGLLLVAVLPDMILELVWLVRGPTPRPVRPVMVRRYQRSPAPTPRTAPRPAPLPDLNDLISSAAMADPSEPPVDPSPASGRPKSALEAMTLDLGDLPNLADWPDDVDDLDLADLGDFGDLPDWPDEMADVPESKP